MARVLSGCWVLAAAIFLTTVSSRASAQVIQAPLTDGFVKSSSIAMSVDEMLGIRKARAAEEPILGPGYPNLWIGEVQFKPLRLIRLSWTDARTGKTQQEIVRYMVYRMIRRDYTELAGADKQDLELKLADPNTDPSNVLDPDDSRPLQMPRFLLQSNEVDGTPIAMWQDEVNVSIQNAVFAREMGRRGLNLKLFNSVEGLQEIGEPVPAADPDALQKAVYGVAVWRNVDDKADFFTVYMSGFSNAYRISTDASGNQVVEEKVVIQKFERPGDEFRQEELEYRLVEEADLDKDGSRETRYPLWQYRPRTFNAQIPDLNNVLRNIRSSQLP
ncbi:MAG: hypothetical protein RLZZ436_2873 [Planctomycetota bacterium]|jgi:hypothetical protein